MGYHYGQTIREYREKKNISLTKLASMWPSKEEGVTSRYVSDIERGKKYISDINVLRKLASMLDIPLWKFGLSEYNPFSQEEAELSKSHIPDYVLLDSYVQQLSMIKATSGVVLDTHTTYINKHLSNVAEQYPSCLSDKRFMCILSQAIRLNAVKAYENTQYSTAVRLFLKMIETAKISEDTESIAIAYMGTGVELMRQEKYADANAYLQQAKDYSLQNHVPKVVRTLICGMLARYYAYLGDIYNFEKFADFTANFSKGLHMGLNKSIYIYHNPSQSLEEISNGYILLNDGQKALDVLPEIDKQVAKDRNLPLSMWMPLDYAQSYLAMNEIEESIQYLKAFFEKISPIMTPHILSKVTDHLEEIHRRGYKDLVSVKDFREMLKERA